MKKELISLRDVSVFAFVMLNALFVLIVFLLQLNKENLHIQWPFNARNSISYDADRHEIIIEREYLELEPIGLLFVLFFGVILMVQFVAMLVHRFATVSQILATTQLDWYCGKTSQEITAHAELRGAAVDMAKILQKPQPQWDENDMTDEQQQIGRRQTIHRILYQHRNRQDWSNLETNFRRRYFHGDLDKMNLGRFSRKSIKLLETRRKSVVPASSSGTTTTTTTTTGKQSRKSLNQPSMGFQQRFQHQGYMPATNLSTHQAFDNRAFEDDDGVVGTAGAASTSSVPTSSSSSSGRMVAPRQSRVTFSQSIK